MPERLNNFNLPRVTVDEIIGTVYSGETATLEPNRVVEMLKNYYDIGYLQVMNRLNVECRVEEDANIGSVLDESRVRRNLGTWHRETDGRITEGYKIEYEEQCWFWLDPKYPLQRSTAADPGLIVLADVPSLDFMMVDRANIRVDTNSLTLSSRPNPRDTGDFDGQVPLLYDFPVPQYYIDPACFRLKSDNWRLTLNNYIPDNYKFLGNAFLELDTDRVVIRPRIGVNIVYSYYRYILILSEDRPNKEVIGGNTFGVCVPILPVYPPQVPEQIVRTEP